MTILEAKGLTVDIPTEDGVVHAVRNVSFSVRAGSLFGIAGESGSGKSVLTQAVTGLLANAEIGGEVLFEGRNLIGLPQEDMRRLRGGRIGMIFQDPLSSLHPFYTIGAQIAEVLHAHERVSAAEARARVVDMLGKVGIPSPKDRFDDYPHQFSGGMRQRVMIAMALILKPALVIADEPTTALDVTVQAQIVALLDTMRRDFGTTVILITHDLGLLSSVADDVMVMYAGHRLEYGRAADVFRQPTHPYTAGLLRSTPASYRPGTDLAPIGGRPPSLLATPAGCVFAPRCAEALPRCTLEPPPLRLYSDGVESLCWLEEAAGKARPMAEAIAVAADVTVSEPVAEIENVRLTYQAGSFFGPKRSLDVLKGIDLTIGRGETVGLVGESGCGKSTLARIVAGLVPATSGSVRVLGRDMGALDARQWREMRQHVQLVFQDPFGSLNPRRRVGAIIGDPFRLHGIASGEARRAKVRDLMEIVGLNPEHYNRFPSEFSGGQRQRIGIARALALNPGLIICDEPVSALDVSIQAQVLNLLRRLQREFGLTYLFISHDLSVVRHVCDRIAVMQDGRIVELATAERLFADPRHPYTKTLLSASKTIPAFAEGEQRSLVETRQQVAS
ncbi:ABC transporter ATP-binding protein [Sinorhizobium sp. RAC02]|uniref:dipeptide ABC transporter ATP-binding protein n=1 Tax=Sinorhizobium sp. RAC02 TaxID=1842534 RepID=UPI00083D6E12|nr:ABC transporter ATP-binding protein [Sinorhizobium sp. RAC02]AOF94266.1 nickel import ATP-binding protein NikE [Sinorhizobium sp. RAC02]